MNTELKKGIKSLLGRVANITGVSARTFGSTCTIVAFHRVNDEIPEDGLTCPSAKFKAFCRFFTEHFRVISLSEQVAGARAGHSMAGTLAITFDDGYRDNHDVAAPILHDYRLPAAFFLTTGFIGSSVVAPWDRELPTQQRWMTWDHVRSLVFQGFEIGSHSDTHIDLGNATPADVRKDLLASQTKLLKELGMETRLFAYPFGGPQHISEDSRRLVRELGFDCCISCHGGINAPIPDPYNLNRIGIAEWYSNPYQFAFELASGRA